MPGRRRLSLLFFNAQKWYFISKELPEARIGVCLTGLHSNSVVPADTRKAELKAEPPRLPSGPSFGSGGWFQVWA